MLPPFLDPPNPDIFLSENYIVLDFETDTSGGNYGAALEAENHLLLAVWEPGPGHPAFVPSDGPTDCAVLSWGGEYEQGGLLRAIEAADFIVAHNAKYELQWLRRCGLDLRRVLPFCTKVAEYVLLGNLAAGDKVLPPRPLSLDACARRRGWGGKDPVVDRLIKNGVNPRDIPRPWLESRCLADVRTTHDLFRAQRQALKATGRLPVAFTRCLLTPALADIEFNGMALDAPRVEEEYAAHEQKLRELTAKMDELTGGINWRSPQQAGKFIYGTLGFPEKRRADGSPVRSKVFTRTLKDGTVKQFGGHPLVDQRVLAGLKATTKAQKEFLDLRTEIGKTAAALSKSLEFFVAVCRERGGTFRASFNQTTTATQRLSSSGIPLAFKMFGGDERTTQFQNLPRAFKRLFRAATPGHKLLEADGAQLEFRVAAEEGNDEVAYHDIVTGHDVHRFTASQLCSVEQEAVTPAQRQAAKSDTFKPLYGGERGTKAQMRYYAAFRDRYKGIAKTQQGWVRQVLNDKRLITSWGLRFYWPHASVGRDGYVNVKSAVYNYPIQCLATAEIIPVGVVYFWHRTASLAGCKIVNTVHDSIVAEVAPEAEALAVQLVKQSLTLDVYRYLEVVYGKKFRVPLGCGIKVGEYWGEAKEQSYNIYPDGREEKVK